MITFCNRMNKLEFAVFQSTDMGFSINMMKHDKYDKTQGKIDLRNESGRPMKVKVVGEVSEK